jgi:hypothetical protein
MQPGVICLDSFLETVGKILLTTLVITGSVAFCFMWVVARRAQPRGSDEELYFSDGDPATTNDHLRAPDPRSLPIGRAYGDTYKAPRWWSSPALPITVTVLMAVFFAWRALGALSGGANKLEPGDMIAGAVFIAAGYLVWHYIFGDLGKHVSKLGTRRAKHPREYMGITPAEPAFTGERPRARRKRKYRRQL